MKILIPSYHRSDGISTLDLFAGVGRENIVVSTQTEEDYEAYKRAHGDRATIIFRPCDCVGGNRNTLLQWCEDRGISDAVMLDDDIEAFLLMDGTRITNLGTLMRIITRCQSKAVETGAQLWGGYPVANPFFMKKRVRPRCIVIGTILGFTDTSVRFDERFRTKEDYELSLRLISRGGNVLRFDYLAMAAKHYSKGGCEDEWKAGKTEIFAKALVKKYPGLCKMNARRPGEIIYTGK